MSRFLCNGAVAGFMGTDISIEKIPYVIVSFGTHYPPYETSIQFQGKAFLRINCISTTLLPDTTYM